MPTPDLSRFEEAQAPHLSAVYSELRSGEKRSHWMWFIFPQHISLSQSPISKRYGIVDLEYARAYLRHPSLSATLRECVTLASSHPSRSAREIFGEVDALKLRSCLTLFLAASERPEDKSLFQLALTQLYGGVRCKLTLTALSDP